jgi:hypothetical protein
MDGNNGAFVSRVDPSSSSERKKFHSLPNGKIFMRTALEGTGKGLSRENPTVLFGSLATFHNPEKCLLCSPQGYARGKRKGHAIQPAGDC